jgi:hypothetical protein
VSTVSESSVLPRSTATPRPPASWRWPRLVAWLALGAFSGGALLASSALSDAGLRPDEVTAGTPATAVGVASLCYLAAAATGLRWVSWAAVPVTSALPFAAAGLGIPRWALFGALGVVLLTLGVLTRRPSTGPQALAMAGYFGVALAALALAPRVGLALAAVALIAHAAWDVVHYRRDVVVKRSLAVWCIGFDVALGGACLALAVMA